MSGAVSLAPALSWAGGSSVAGAEEHRTAASSISGVVCSAAAGQTSWPVATSSSACVSKPNMISCVSCLRTLEIPIHRPLTLTERLSCMRVSVLFELTECAEMQCTQAFKPDAPGPKAVISSHTMTCGKEYEGLNKARIC